MKVGLYFTNMTCFFLKSAIVQFIVLCKQSFSKIHVDCLQPLTGCYNSVFFLRMVIVFNYNWALSVSGCGFRADMWWPICFVFVKHFFFPNVHG